MYHLGYVKCVGKRCDCGGTHVFAIDNDELIPKARSVIVATTTSPFTVDALQAFKHLPESVTDHRACLVGL